MTTIVNKPTHDGCVGCMFEPCDENEPPCEACKYSVYSGTVAFALRPDMYVRAYEPVPANQPDKRTAFLDEVAKIVNGERQDMYGSPEDSFKLIAEFWSSYLGMVITPMHVAMMMVLLKVARQAGKPKDDNLVDIAGYAACAAGLERG